MSRLALLSLALILGCKEERPPLKFRAPKSAQTSQPSLPTSMAQSQPQSAAAQPTSATITSRPTTTRAPSSLLTSAGFSCLLDDTPWSPKQDDRFQGLILRRPGKTPEATPTEVIAVVLQNQQGLSLLLELPFAKGGVAGAKLTLTMKNNVAKGESSVSVSKLEGAEGDFLMDATFSATLHELGDPKEHRFTDCQIKDLPVRSLYVESPAEED